LTGPPASGKSTLTSILSERLTPCKTFVYSKLLRDHLSRKLTDRISEKSIRKQSSRVVFAEDVAKVDKELIKSVTKWRKVAHVIIDSHAVTKESYGFRVTPFSMAMLKELKPTLIFMLYAEPSVIRSRIDADSQGRPTITAFEAETHNFLQASVAITYSILQGTCVYFLDSNKTRDKLANEIQKRVSRNVQPRGTAHLSRRK
jgi:adenylate kinase